jgi:hypothetical protein
LNFGVNYEKQYTEICSFPLNNYNFGFVIVLQFNEQSSLKLTETTDQIHSYFMLKLKKSERNVLSRDSGKRIKVSTQPRKNAPIPTGGNIFLPVHLLVWADGRGTVAQADSAARAEL